MIRRKKILIVNNNLNSGGVQRSLINLLDAIKDQYDITVFIFNAKGVYVDYIPANIEVIAANSWLKLLAVSQHQLKENKIFFMMRAILVLICKVFTNFIPIALCIQTQKKLKGFDYAISYLHSAAPKSLYGGCNEFVLKRVEAKQKIGFIHCDFLNCGINTQYNRKLYQKFDKIAAVSKGCKDSFIKVMPELQDRTYCVNNYQNYENILLQANDNPVVYDHNYFNIVTVSRISEEKGLNRANMIIQRLINGGYHLKWHVIGDGDMVAQLSAEIKKNEMQNNIILYGNQDNPYRFMRNADLFMLPSFHEAAPMVFNEAKCLGIPILATKTTSTKEMIEDCNAGWVCENSTEGIQAKLEYILRQMNVIEIIRENLKQQKFDNKQAVEQFKCMLEGKVLDD